MPLPGGELLGVPAGSVVGPGFGAAVGGVDPQSCGGRACRGCGGRAGIKESRRGAGPSQLPAAPARGLRARPANATYPQLLRSYPRYSTDRQPLRPRRVRAPGPWGQFTLALEDKELVEKPFVEQQSTARVSMVWQR